MTKRLHKSAMVTLLTIVLCAMSMLCAFGFTGIATARAETTASVWNGDLIAAGWGDTETNKTPAPSGYVRDDTAKTVQIGSAAAFAYFAHESNLATNNGFKDYTVSLECDVDLNNKAWVPIGMGYRFKSFKPSGYDTAFRGTFDGNRHTIYNFNGTNFLKALVMESDKCYVQVDSAKVEFILRGNDECHYGLFGVICSETVDSVDYLVSIRNLTIDNFVYDFGAEGIGTDVLGLTVDVGAFVGFANNSFTFENCKTNGGYIKGAKKFAQELGRIETAAGFVSRAYNGDTSITDSRSSCAFSNCVNNIDINLDDGNQTQRATGFIGFSGGSASKEIKFENCVNNGDMTAAVAGGYQSWNQGAGNVIYRNCRNTGAITSNVGGGTYGSIAAGFAGSLNATSLTMTDCTNEGDITSNAGEGVISRVTGFVSGLVNTQVVKLENCTNFGNITNHSTGTAATSEIGGAGSFTAGILGYANQNYQIKKEQTYYVKDSVNCGKISYATSETNADKIYADGLIAYLNMDNRGDFTFGRYGVSIYAASPIGGLPETNLESTAYDLDAVTELTEANGLILEENGTVLAGIAENVTGGDYKIVVPSTVTRIKERAFLGMGTAQLPKFTNGDKTTYYSLQTKFVKEIDFSQATKLESIGELAFAGTDINVLEFPNSIKSIERGAFAQTKLVSVVIPASVKEIEQAAFGNIATLKQIDLKSADVEFGADVFNGASADALVITNDREQYDNYTSEDFASVLTYPVTVEYFDLGSYRVVDTETKLYGRDYKLICQDGLWREGNINYVGTASAGAGATAWYGDDNCTTALTVDSATQLLANATGNAIRLYTKNVGVSDEYIARTDIVYAGTAYPLSAINVLLAPNSKKVTSETVTLAKFNGANTSKDRICDAGVYTVQIGDKEIEITVNKAKVDLALSANLVWRVNNSVTMLDRTLYIYDTAAGGKYPSLSAMEDGKIDGVITLSVQTKTVIDSVVRSRGAGANLVLALLTDGKGFTVSSSNATATGVGMYTSTFTLTADDNHALVLTGAVTNAASRGITVTDNEDGTFTVTKVWYVVDMDNWFVGSNGEDYAVADRAYGSTDSVTVPTLMYKADSMNADAVTFVLTYNGTTLPEFHAADFNKYFNNMMPVGSYTLTMSAKAFDYEVDNEEDPDGEKITLHSPAFTQSVSFNVTAVNVSEIAATQFAAITEALNGQTFEFILGATETSADNAAVQSAVTAALEEIKRTMPASSIDGNVWTGNIYIGEPVLAFNSANAMSNSYITTFVKPTTAGVYTYYYKVTALNYADASADADGILYSFTVAAYEYVDLPSVADLAKSYTGEKLTADVIGTAAYTVTENNGGVNVGEYDVVFELVRPDCTLWKGQTLENKTSGYTVKFVITKSVNDWLEAPDIVRWVEGKYNEEENTFIGAAKFGEITYIITDADDNVLYDAAQGINKLASLKAGKYFLRASVAATDNYNGLSEAFTIRVLEKIGLPWWGTLCITLGALLIAVIIILILWKKGVFQILTGKIVLAIRTRASVDATIASVRAAKRMEEGKKSVAEAKRRERLEEARKKAEAERALPPEERAAIIEAKAQAQAEKAEKMRLQSEALKECAKKVRGGDAQQQPNESEQEAAAAADADSTSL